MKKRRTISSLIIAVLLITLGACTKFGKNITIEGRVENPITGEGIPGVEIWLLKTTWGINGANKSVKTVFSDNNGNFEINIRNKLRIYNLERPIIKLKY